MPSWQLSLEADNKSPRTIESYLDATKQLGAFLTEHGMPTDVTSLAREHIEAFQVHIRGTARPRPPSPATEG